VSGFLRLLVVLKKKNNKEKPKIQPNFFIAHSKMADLGAMRWF
jgi:hypothetical protein